MNNPTVIGIAVVAAYLLVTWAIGKLYNRITEDYYTYSVISGLTIEFICGVVLFAAWLVYVAVTAIGTMLIGRG